MAEIKLIKHDTDLSGLKRPIGWDLEVNGKPYDVYRVEGYNHTIGGRWGENCYWACPAGETPTYNNLIEFSGDAPSWGITFERKNYIKNKHDETSIECNGNCWITRNDKKFYNIAARHMEYGLAKAQHLLTTLLEECPLNLSHRNWKEEAIGRKIWYNGQPAVIQRVTDDNELWIIPDGIDRFKPPAHWTHSEWCDYEDGLRIELLSPNIYWFRD